MKTSFKSQISGSFTFATRALGREPSRTVGALRFAVLAPWLVCSLGAMGCSAARDATPQDGVLQKAADYEANNGMGSYGAAGETSQPSDTPPNSDLEDPATPSWSYPEDPNKVLTGDPTEDDDYLSFIKHRGFESLVFATTCVSKKDGEATIEDENALPAGGGRYLECATDFSPARMTKDVMSTKNERWCALGKMASHTPWGAPELHVSVTRTPSDGPWTLVATHDGPEITVGKVGLSGGTTWPVGVKVELDTVDMKAAPAGVCDSFF